MSGCSSPSRGIVLALLLQVQIGAWRLAMRWKRDAEFGGGVAHSEGEATAVDRIRLDLESRGVSTELSEALSAHLAERLSDVSSEVYEALLDGVAAASGFESTAHEEFARNLREFQELERLMGSFVGELSKLDEALEVMAAYLRRMRTNASRHQPQTLH
jgi:hypothetical protein